MRVHQMILTIGNKTRGVLRKLKNVLPRLVLISLVWDFCHTRVKLCDVIVMKLYDAPSIEKRIDEIKFLAHDNWSKRGIQEK